MATRQETLQEWHDRVWKREGGLTGTLAADWNALRRGDEGAMSEAEWEAAFTQAYGEQYPREDKETDPEPPEGSDAVSSDDRDDGPGDT